MAPAAILALGLNEAAYMTSVLDPKLVGEVLDVMRRLDGVVVEAGPADVFANPRHARTRAFLSRVL